MFAKIQCLVNCNSKIFSMTYFFQFLLFPSSIREDGGRKKFPRTSSIVQIIFYVRSFEINDNILRTQK